jgi:hypothetical protein
MISNLKHDCTGYGYTHTGLDGILRSFNSTNQVIDYHVFTGAEFKANWNAKPFEISEDLKTTLFAVGGTLVPEADIWNPPASLQVPQPMPGTTPNPGVEAKEQLTKRDYCNNHGC